MATLTAVVLPLVVLSLCALQTDAQARMSITPPEVILTSSSPVFTTFECSFASGISVNRVYSMQILRQRRYDPARVPLAEVKPQNANAPGFVKNAPADIQRRGKVSGGIDISSPANSSLVLTLNTTTVRCSDQGHYFCSLSYKDTRNLDHQLEANMTLSIYALPRDVRLIGTKNGTPIQGTNTSEAHVSEGETVQLTCSAKIGSDNTTAIRWRRATETGSTDNAIPYNPPFGSHNESQPVAIPNECTYSRTATIKYTVTPSDAKRVNHLAFQCYVSVIPPNGQRTYEAEQIFYINPRGQESRASTVGIHILIMATAALFIIGRNIV